MSFLIKDARNFVGQEVEIHGWVFNKRSSGSVIFLQLRDGSGFIQAVVSKNEVSPEVFATAQETRDESTVVVAGHLKEEPRSPFSFEIQTRNLKIVSLAQTDFPISAKEHGVDFLLGQRHLWLRFPRQWAILRIRDQIASSINQFLHREGYTRLDSPILTPSACEGTTTLFPVPYLPAWPDVTDQSVPSWLNLDQAKPYAYLSQSGQLYLEAGIASLGKVYDFGPTFRAEKSKTKRHLTEFWMMDAEAAFLEYEGLLDFEEKMVLAVIQDVLAACPAEFKTLERDPAPLAQIKSPFPKLTYEETLKKLRELGSDIKDGEDLGNDDETRLMNYFHQPLFVMKFPATFKAFYFKRDEQRPELTLSSDLLAPEGYGEIIGGGQREDDYDTLLKRMKEAGLNTQDYEWYLDLRRYGASPHSGFGLGLERMVAWICKLEHIREAIPFPRTIYRFTP
ncbi:MAG: asparagine--tRNA ligase [Candidatus Nealsonbacteria bacterium]|nr:asparagine--tRNA ligase [Candidatus Nealsonbacteria bacterium]